MRTAIVLLLCAIFFLLAMGLTLLSSNVYRSTARDADQNDTARTALSYMVNRVHQSDTSGGIYATNFGGSDALQLRQTINGARYVTLLYCYDHSLRELFTPEGTVLTPADGIAIVPLSSLQLKQSDSLLTIAVSSDAGQTAQVSISPRSGWEVAS